jgi:hypothetical protein
MAKNKTVKNEATAKEAAAQTTNETVKAEPTVAEQAGEPVKAEAAKADVPVTEKVIAATTAATEKVVAVTEAATEKVVAATEAVKAEAVKAEAAVTEAAGQVASFVKTKLEQAQRQLGEIETDAQKVLQTVVSRVQRLNVNELRGTPAVQKLEKQALWVGGEVRQRLTGLRSRMVTVVGGVASQSQVDALNRELDRLSRKLDSLVPSKKAETQQPPPVEQAQSQQQPQAR